MSDFVHRSEEEIAQMRQRADFCAETLNYSEGAI